MYNFNEIQDRSNNQSIKHEFLEPYFGDKELIPLWVADMDFKTSDAIIEALDKRVKQGIYGYTAFNEGFYESFINWVENKYNWTLTKDDLIFSPGVVMSLLMSIEAFTDINDEIIIQTPVYGPFKRSIEDQNRCVVENPLLYKDESYEMDFIDLEKKLKTAKMMILCNPQNPIGRVWDKDTLSTLGHLLVKYDVTLIADEIHSDLILKGHVHTPISTLNIASLKIVTCMSPSKTFNLAGLQSSIIVVEDKLMNQQLRNTFTKKDILINNCFGQVAFEAAYSSGQPWLSSCLSYIEENIDYVINYIRNYIPKMNINKPQGTYLLWLDCRAMQLSQDDLVKFFVEDAKLALNDGSDFGYEGRGFMRMNIACSRKVLEDAMEQLKVAYEKYLKTL